MFRGRLISGVFGMLSLLGSPLVAGELWIGAASADITPSQPVALDGQFDLRVSHKPDTPVTANVLALASPENGQPHDAAVMVSCDLVMISPLLLDDVQQAVHKRMPDFDLKKLFLNATHTHTAPLTRSGVYELPKQGVMGPEEYSRSRPIESPRPSSRHGTSQAGQFHVGAGARRGGRKSPRHLRRRPRDDVRRHDAA